MSEENNFSGNIDDLITPEFDAWWEESGQFIRSGGDSYNRSFAYGAFRHLMPEILAAREAKKTPVWTSADQKAGKLPEVGCDVRFSSSKKQFNLVAKGIDGQYCGHDGNELFLCWLGDIEPIETEAERQQREFREIHQAVRKGCIITDNEEQAFELAVRVTIQMLQSGELKLPEVRK